MTVSTATVRIDSSCDQAESIEKRIQRYADGNAPGDSASAS